MSAPFAPELMPARAWLNCEAPIRLSDLAGKVVLLVFWSAGCISSQRLHRIVATLLARNNQAPLAVLGVHSAKHRAEEEPERVAAAVVRERIAYPVVVDKHNHVLRRFGLRTWPALVLVDGKGRIAGVAPGEPDLSILQQLLNGLLQQAEGHATGLQKPGRKSATNLYYPTRAALSPGGWLALSEAGRHRVLLFDPNGRQWGAIGCGIQGAVDGKLHNAMLDEPQGLAWDSEGLWVCDAGSHRLLRVDFSGGTVTTVAGTGECGNGPLSNEGSGPSLALRAPMDVVCSANHVFLALAGSHQVAYYHKQSGDLGVLAGCGALGCTDGDSKSAKLAQPSGLCLVGEHIYIAESHSGAVRKLDLARAELSTVFGATVRHPLDEGAPGLQLPLAVTSAGRRTLLLADSYNDRIVRLDTKHGTLTPFYALGNSTERSLYQPTGVGLFPNGDVLVVEASRARLVRLSADGVWLEEVSLAAAPTPLPPTPSKTQAVALKVVHGPRQLAHGHALLVLSVQAPRGFRLSQKQPVRLFVQLAHAGDVELPANERLEAPGGGRTAEFVLHARLSPGAQKNPQSEMLVVADAELCQDGKVGGGEDTRARGCFRIPLPLAERGERVVRAALPLAAPEEIVVR